MDFDGQSGRGKGFLFVGVFRIGEENELMLSYSKEAGEAGAGQGIVDLDEF
jgi:hypothetical protein